MDHHKQNEIEKALKYDPIATAEKLVGGRADALSLLLHMGHQEKKHKLLKENRDTTWRMNPDEYKSIVLDLGFEIVLQDSFESVDPWDNHLTDEWFIAWQPGMLLWWDTYGHGKKSVNTATLYYNWRFLPKTEEELEEGEKPLHIGHFISTGHMLREGEHQIIVGDHDVREGLRHTLVKFLRNGEFVTPWIERPHLWLCEHAVKPPEKNDYNWSGYDEACDAKLQKLPQHVKDMIGPEKS